MNCSNCNARLSCGCQKRVASDGKACCSTCISFYEKNLIEKKAISSPITTVNKNVWGADRYKTNK